MSAGDIVVMKSWRVDLLSGNPKKPLQGYACYKSEPGYAKVFLDLGSVALPLLNDLNPLDLLKSMGLVQLVDEEGHYTDAIGECVAIKEHHCLQNPGGE